MLHLTATSRDEGALCPIRSVLAPVTGKWAMLILFALADGSLRFGALRRVIGDVTQRVLTENLRALERDGYLTRHVEPGPPVAVHYALTPLGDALVARLRPLADWAAGAFDSVAANRAAFAARG